MKTTTGSPFPKVTQRLPAVSWAFTAVQREDPPPPGTSQPRVPGSVSGDYKAEPRSDCLGGEFELKGGGQDLDVVSGEATLGRLGFEIEPAIFGREIHERILHAHIRNAGSDFD